MARRTDAALQGFSSPPVKVRWFMLAGAADPCGELAGLQRDPRLAAGVCDGEAGMRDVGVAQVWRQPNVGQIRAALEPSAVATRGPRRLGWRQSATGRNSCATSEERPRGYEERTVFHLLMATRVISARSWSSPRRKQGLGCCGLWCPEAGRVGIIFSEIFSFG